VAKPIRPWVATALALAAALALAGCPASDGSGDATPPPAPTDTTAVGPEPTPDGPTPTHGTGQTLRVGIRTDLPGVGLLTDGEPTGLGPDVAAYVAAKLGYSPYDIQWVDARPDNREELLRSGAVDFVVAAYSITDQRAEQVQFAGPYLVAGQDLMVRAEDATINGAADLAGRTVCEVPGSTAEGRIEDLVPGAQVVQADSYVACAQLVVDGAVDAAFTDDIILAGIAASDDFFALVRLVGVPGASERYGIGLPPDSTQRCEAINAALVEMVDDGSWQRFIDRHTGGTGYHPDPLTNPPAPDGC